MISIVIPTYNRMNMLKQMLDSIGLQTYKDYEIIIIDDCSSDGTEEMIYEMSKSDYRIRYHKNNCNMGPGYNRNRGYVLAKGEYVIFADDDDYYTDCHFFQEAIQVFNENTEKKLSCVCANAMNLYMESGRVTKGNIGVLGQLDGVEFLINMEIKYHKPLSTFPAVFAKEALQLADLENMKMVNDYAIYLRALLYGDIFVMDRYVGMYRQHENNISLSIQREFLIENMEERFWVKERLKNRVSQSQINMWWYIQMRIVFTYFVYNANAKWRDVFFVTKWILHRTGFAPKMWGMLFFRGIKLFLKKALKKL